MRAVVQRVQQASVEVGGEVVGSIGPGLLVLLGIAPGDGEPEVAWMAGKLAGLRLFASDDGRMDRSVVDIGGAVLCVSQFTLYGDVRKGRRPSFVGAAAPALAEPLYRRTCEALETLGLPVARGVFGAHMEVRLVNDGPVTLVIDSP
ncbi:MAG: D-tyrosyl-tRNA(Tyr) deacylase [Alphaproteobacteria bacterium]|nr:D-tyrosyl-tRNA(Tyr) deacylase [Alphaproteobacteria bacterium]